MSVIGLCFTVELFMVKPEWTKVWLGFIPMDTRLFTDKEAVFAALGILGATVMPHNLYLHSSIVKHRIAMKKSDGLVVKSGTTDLEDPSNTRRADDIEDIEGTIKYATADSMVALFLALLINAAILIVSAAAFHARGLSDIKHIEDASALMREWLGPASAIIFGLALLAAGQSSTVTGTLAGQIVFEGFLNLQMTPWMRRLVTRVVAIVPALLIVLLVGQDSINQLLLYSQVILSFQLPFAIIPLIIFVFSPPPPHATQSILEYHRKLVGTRKEQILKFSAWVVAVSIVALNILYLLTLFIG
jgi:manganese transport protein